MVTKSIQSTCLTLLLTLASLAYSDDCIQVIRVKTGDVPDAGTDAIVSLKLYDGQGNSLWVSNLEDAGIMSKYWNYFERNDLDSFSFESGCLASKVCKIELEHNNGFPQPGWYVSYLQVATVWPNNCTQTTFQTDQWLAKDEYPYSLSVTKDLCSSSQLNFNPRANDSLLNLPSLA
ncbi:hypothetical protein RND81_13G144300 [Saponaria officinalis]|uniref:PLAT domain-containing protein n=1 Tax=Saponaria officinalis TaxID=3572 RepID=A0AAW1H1D2_SAPOF